MQKDCKTRIQMEESYAMMSIPYRTMEEKQNLLKNNDDAISIFNESPDVYIKPFEPGKGKLVIEFRFNNRLTGDYFSYIIDKCNLEVEKN